MFTAFQMTSVIVIRDVRAVGMHHHCPSKALILGSRYTCIWEPECLFDPGNAIAIKDQRKTVRAYFSRKEVAIISRLFCAGIVQRERMYCVTEVEPHVELHDLGPQQECTIQFKVATGDVDLLKYIVSQLNYTCNAQ